MTTPETPAIDALQIDGVSGTTYPDEFADPVRRRYKRAIGDHFGLTGYGVNLVELEPGAWSAQRHWHTHEDELVYVVSGELTLISNAGEQRLSAGMVAGFKAGVEDGHHLVNRSQSPASYLEIGDRRNEDEVYYPDIDLELRRDGNSGHVFTRRDGTPCAPATTPVTGSDR